MGEGKKVGTAGALPCYQARETLSPSQSLRLVDMRTPSPSFPPSSPHGKMQTYATTEKAKGYRYTRRKQKAYREG
jgi:hypothetical protein